MHRPAVQGDGPGVGLVESGQDVHEGRLARPVLADQRQHLAAPDLQGHVVAGQDAGKALGDALKLEFGDGLGGFFHGNSRITGENRCKQNQGPSAPGRAGA
jgi:hypothetical protein